MALHMALEQIGSREELALFVDELRRDLESNPGSWENAELASFLEAMSAWLWDMDGYYRNLGQSTPTSPTWKTLGEILLASRIYE